MQETSEEALPKPEAMPPPTPTTRTVKWSQPVGRSGWEQLGLGETAQGTAQRPGEGYHHIL